LNQFFRIYFILENVWKIIHNNDKDLNIKELRFSKFLNCFLKEKSVDYVNGAVHRMHSAGPWSMVPSLNTSHSIVDGRLRLERRRGTRD
jgi:hypothetical protein